MVYENGRVYEGSHFIIQVIGNAITNTDRDIRNLITNVSTKETILMADLKESEDIAGLMDSIMKVNG